MGYIGNGVRAITYERLRSLCDLFMSFRENGILPLGIRGLAFFCKFFERLEVSVCMRQGEVCWGFRLRARLLGTLSF